MLITDSYREQQLGLVLKNFFPEQAKLAVLTRKLGRLDLIVTNKLVIHKISYGMLIGYSAPNITGSESQIVPKLKISELELVYMPTVLPDQLLFWHQLLELIFYTVPVGLYIPDLFELVCFAGANLNFFGNSAQKLLILCKILSLLGIYPVDYHSFTPELCALMSLPIDISRHQKIDLKWERELQQWWQTSMAAHPKVNLFKTVAY